MSDMEAGHFIVRYFDSERVGPLVQLSGDREAGLSCRAAKEGQHGFESAQRIACPIGTDMVEQTMFYRVPLRCSRGIVADGDFQAVLVGPALQLPFPQSRTTTVAAARIGGNQQPLRLGKPAAASGSPPTSNRRHGEGGCVARRSDTHMPFVVLFVVDGVRNGAAGGILRKVVGVDLIRLATPAPTGIFEIADQLLFLRIHADSRVACALERLLLPLNLAELPVPIRVRRTREAFSVHTRRKSQLAQQSPDGMVGDSPSQPPAEVSLAAAHPFAAGDWMPARFAFGQPQQFLLDGGSFFSTGIRPPPGRRTRSTGRPANSASNSSRPRRIVCTCNPVTNDI